MGHSKSFVPYLVFYFVDKRHVEGEKIINNISTPICVNNPAG